MTTRARQTDTVLVWNVGLCCELGFSAKQITNAAALLLSLLFIGLNKYLTGEENNHVTNSY